MGRNHQPRGPYRNKKHYTRGEMLRYLRDNHICSRSHFGSVRKPGDPTLWSILREFRSWGEAIRTANDEPRGVVFDKSYLAKAVCEFGLWTIKKFIDAHNNSPKIIPSRSVVLKIFGSFRELFKEARKNSIKRTLLDYLRLANKLRRIPLLGDVKRSGLDIASAVTFYGSKREMDEFLFGKEEVKNARKRRSS